MPMAAPQQQGGWVWDGSNWVCDPDCGAPPSSGFPCPPSSFPPPGCPPWFPPPQGQPPWYPGANAGVSFSATAPPNPIRGNFWWDGKTLWMFDGAMWVAVGGTIVPQLGVTDGSNAPVGYVGEFMQLTGTMAYADVPTYTTGTIQPGVITAGDWDLWAYAHLSSFVNGVIFQLNPQPTGMSNLLSGILGTLDQNLGTTVENALIVGQTGRGSFSVPTLLAFQCQVFQPAAAGAGTGPGTLTLTVGARRRR
jgi:hypothetical protein